MLYIFGPDENLIALLKPDFARSTGPTTTSRAFLRAEFPAELDREPAAGCPYWDAVHYEVLNGENTFEFTVPGNQADAAYVTEGNLVAFKDLDSYWQFFEIKKIVDTHGDDLTRTAHCEHIFYELLDDFIEDRRPTDVSAHFALTQALSGTRWEPGTVHDLGLNSTNYYYQSALAAAQKVASVWKGELQFRVVVTGGVISNRYVDLLARRGADTGKQFEYGRHTREIEREVDLTTVATALYGRGKGVEVGEGYGRRLNFADIEWSVANGDQVDKPLGQEWVGDPEALAQWGRKGGRHRFSIFEDPEETDPVVLLQKTWGALQERKNPRATYRLGVADLERLSGYEHEKVRLGDTARCIDRKFNPPLLVEARVIEIDKHLLRPEETKITLGNFPPTLSDDALKQQEVAQTVRDRQGVWDKATDFQPGEIPTSWLDGIIDVLQNQLKSTTSNWYTDNNGNLVFETLDGTAAMMLTGNGFMLSNQKDANGAWTWRTFGTGDGFTADELNAGQIRTSLIQIIGNSNFYWDGDYLYITNPEDLNQQIRLSKEGIRFTKDGGQTWGVAMDFDGLRMEGKSQDGYTHYTGDGTKVYDEAGNLVGHMGSFETFGEQVATFNRDSTAYLSDGTQVAAGVPRFEDGGVIVEEGCTNIIPAWPTSWAVFGNAGMSGVNQGVQAGAAENTVRLTNSGATEGFYTDYLTPFALSPATKYTLRFKARGTVVAGKFRAHVLSNTGTEVQASVTPNLNGVYQAFIVTFTTTADITGTNQYVRFDHNGNDAGYIEIAEVSLIQKAYPLTFPGYGATRIVETLDAPTAGIFTKGSWTIEQKIILSPGSLLSVFAFPWLMASSVTGEHWLLEINNGQLRGRVASGGVIYPTAYSAALVANTPYDIMFTGDGTNLRLFINGVQIGGDISYTEPTGAVAPTMNIGYDALDGNVGQLNGIISDFRISNRVRTLAEHQAAYNSGLSLWPDDATTLLMGMDGTLLPTTMDYGLYTKNGRIILQDPLPGQGVELWDGNQQKVLIGRLDDGTVGQIIRGGKLYSSLIRSGGEGDTSYVQISPGDTPIEVIKNGKVALSIWSHTGEGQIQFFDTNTDKMYGQISAINDSHGEQLQIKGRSAQGARKNVVLDGDSIILEAGYEVNIQGNLFVTGSMSAGGSKPARQKTENYGYRNLYARESPDVRYIIEGKARLIAGICKVEIDPIFMECVEPNTEQTPWIVGNLVPIGAPVEGLHVVEIGPNYVLIQEPSTLSNAQFFWTLSAVRKGFAGIWLEQQEDEEDLLVSGWEDEIEGVI